MSVQPIAESSRSGRRAEAEEREAGIALEMRDFEDSPLDTAEPALVASLMDVTRDAEAEPLVRSFRCPTRTTRTRRPGTNFAISHPGAPERSARLNLSPSL